MPILLGTGFVHDYWPDASTSIYLVTQPACDVYRCSTLLLLPYRLWRERGDHILDCGDHIRAVNKDVLP